MTPSQRWSDGLLIVSVAGLLLVLSLAVYSRTTTGMQDDDRGFNVKHYVMGLPGWLELNIVRLKPASSLAYARSFAKAAEIPLGWQVRPLQLAVSVAACLLLGAVVVGLNRACCVRVRKNHLGRLAWGLGIGVAPALVVGSIVPTEPKWIGACLVMGLLPLCVMCASAIVRDYLRGVGLGFLVAVAIIWSQRLTDVFGVPDGIQSPPIVEDLPPVAVFGSYYAAVSLVATFAARLLQSRTRHAEPGVGADSR